MTEQKKLEENLLKPRLAYGLDQKTNKQPTHQGDFGSGFPQERGFRGKKKAEVPGRNGGLQVQGHAKAAARGIARKVKAVATEQ